jgi:hypothetical protein
MSSRRTVETLTSRSLSSLSVGLVLRVRLAWPRFSANVTGTHSVAAPDSRATAASRTSSLARVRPRQPSTFDRSTSARSGKGSNDTTLPPWRRRAAMTEVI